MPKLEIAISRCIIPGKLPCSGAAILLCERTETDGWPGVRSREGDSKYTQFLAIICRWSIILTSWPWAKNLGPVSVRNTPPDVDVRRISSQAFRRDYNT